ncbi:MAG TPA: hypothetical protein VJQ45_09070 [Ktedonobacterales bacterium]|nr:hypothetical protein [Ktedonobacterales bacterium]
MASNNGTSHDEEQQNDLMAALASARELGPDMDKAVAASYLEKQKQQAAAKAQAQQEQQQAVIASRGQQTPWPMYMTPALGIMLYVVLLVVSHGWLWWTFWLIPAFGGFGWWGRRGDVHEARMQRRVDRYEWRRARYGYGYRYGPYDNGSGPAPSQQQPQVQQPSSQQPPTEYD